MIVNGHNPKQVQEYLAVYFGDDFFEEYNGHVHANFEKLRVRENIQTSKATVNFFENAGETILTADDAGFMLNIIGDILKSNGYNFIQAANGADAVEKYKEHKPALTIMDICMPVKDGVEAVKEIKEMKGGAKIIMVSAMGTPKYICPSLINGAVDFIVKPFQADKLIETVAKHLSEDTALDIEKVRAWLEANAKRNQQDKMSQAEIDSAVSGFVKK
jgi:two-component system chemotaxis response regulator CheY